MKQVHIPVEPSVVEWARKEAGLSTAEAADKIGVFESDIQMWEIGAIEPTIGQLKKAAKVYRFTLALFFLSAPPSKTFMVRRDYRLLPGNEPGSYPPELLAVFRRVEYQRAVAAELAELAEAIPEPSGKMLSLDQDPEDVGRRVRDWLGVSLEDQLNWPRDYHAFSEWVRLVEARDILVTHTRAVPVSTMRGCSFGDDPFPAIVLNSGDWVRARLFTLLHELTHVLLSIDAICDYGTSSAGRAEAVRVERFCNAAAAAILVPRNALVSHPLVAESGPGTPWRLDQIRQLAHPFGISPEAMLLRLVAVGRSTMDYYYRRRADFAHPRDKKQPSGNSGPPMFRQRLHTLGRRYVVEVIDAYDAQYINSSNVVDMLNLGLDSLPPLRAEVGR